MTKYLLDTNVLIRFLLGDHSTLSPEARALFQEAHDGKYTLVLSELVIAEAVLVLSSLYKVERKDIAEKLSTVIGMAGIRCSEKERTRDALGRFRKTNCDYMDCYLGALSVETGYPVATFDKDFRKFKDVRLRERRAASGDV